MHENFKDLGALQEIGVPHRKIYTRTFYHDQKIEGTEPVQKLKHFSECIKTGILPDMNILEEMANNIDRYLCEEEDTLDSAFNLKSKTKSGNAARQYKIKANDVDMFIQFMCYMVENGVTQEVAAEKILADYNMDKDVDSFLRDFRRKIAHRDSLTEQIEERVKDN